MIELEFLEVVKVTSLNSLRKLFTAVDWCAMKLGYFIFFGFVFIELIFYSIEGVVGADHGPQWYDLLLSVAAFWLYVILVYTMGAMKETVAHYKFTMTTIKREGEGEVL